MAPIIARRSRVINPGFAQVQGAGSVAGVTLSADIFTGAMDGNSAGWDGYTMRVAFGPSALIMPSFAPSRIQFTFIAGSIGVNIAEAWAGEQGTSQVYDFASAGRRFQLLFGGATSVSIPALSERTCDAMLFAMDRTKGLVASAFINTAVDSFRRQATRANVSTHYILGNDASTVGATGYATDSSDLTAISNIEVLFNTGEPVFP